MESDICEYARLWGIVLHKDRVARGTLKCHHPKFKSNIVILSGVSNERVKALKYCPLKRKYC